MFKGFDVTPITRGVTPVTRGLTQMLCVVYSDAGILEIAPFLKSLTFWLGYEPKDIGDLCHYPELCFLHAGPPSFLTSLALRYIRTDRNIRRSDSCVKVGQKIKTQDSHPQGSVSGHLNRFPTSRPFTQCSTSTY